MECRRSGTQCGVQRFPGFQPGFHPIGAKIREPSFDSYVFEVVREGVVAAMWCIAAGMRL
jgi:hypothetical protein